MKTQQTEPMNPSEQFCPNERCLARGKVGEGNIRIHDRTRQRYRCRQCKWTFSAWRGTMLEGLRKPTELIVIVVTLLAYGCPVQAIVHAYDLDERTVASWRDRAGTHCQQVHHALIEQGKLDLVHVQADEIRVKGRSLIAWMGFSRTVSTRLWLGGVVSLRRDTALADHMLAKVRACSQTACALLVCTDGWAAYPKSICRAFRDKVKATAGRGRCCLRVWSDLCIATVIKRAEKKRVVEVTRRMTRGTKEQAERLLKASQGGSTREYRVYRAVEWHHARAVGISDAQMSACDTESRSLGNRHVSDWMHVQFLFCASRTLQSSASGICVYTCNGGRSDRSSVEHSRGSDLQDGSCALGQTQTTSAVSKKCRSRGDASKTTARTTSQTRLSTFTS